MKIKWNWGSKILLAMILFMTLLILLAFLSMNQNYDLVEKDYYPKALEYQNKIDKIQNSKALDENVKVENMGNQIQFTFQQSFNSREIKGSIIFYRPSDKRMDVSFPIQTDTSGIQICNVTDLQKGKYIVKIDYEVDGKGFYQEETILLKMQ